MCNAEPIATSTVPCGRTRRDVEQFLHDELLETLPAEYDRAALLAAEHATYVIHQDVAYDYTRPVRDLRQRLVIIPRRRHGDQHRIAHRFEVDADGDHHVRSHVDRHGNCVIDSAVSEVAKRVEFRTRVVVTRSTRPAAPASWRPTPTPTPLTTPDDAIKEAAGWLSVGAHPFDVADEMAAFIRESFEYSHDVTSVRTTAAEAWRLRRGVCQDMAHVMIAMCSSLGIESRYVSGHMVGDGASHAWVEVLSPGRDRVLAIDPTHARRTDLRYITTATGRDYHDVAPTSGTYTSSGGRGKLSVRKAIRVADLA